MPRLKSVQKAVKCLVCVGTTDSANLGMDVCKACTVFYRRSRNRKYVCRSGTDKCPIGEGVNCRKCRMQELNRRVHGKPFLELLRKPDEQSMEAPATPINDSLVSIGNQRGSGSISSASSSTPNSTAATRPLLKRLKHGYRSMCDARLIGELNSRVPPTHPLDSIEGKYLVGEAEMLEWKRFGAQDIVPGTFRSIDAANNIFLTGLLQFGSVVFTGFDELSRDDKWTIVTNFFRRFRAFEAGYRADKVFGQTTDRTFAGFTLYFDGKMSANFFEGCPVTDPKEATRIMEDKFNGDFRTGRTHLATAKLRHEEFLAVLALMFWTLEDLSISEGATKLGKRCREAVLSELHSYFRDELGMDDYAVRLGELLMLLQIFEQRSSCALEHFEVLRLLNVFNEKSISYMVIRDGDA